MVLQATKDGEGGKPGNEEGTPGNEEGTPGNEAGKDSPFTAIALSEDCNHPFHGT